VLRGGTHVDELDPAVGGRRCEFCEMSVRSCSLFALTALMSQARFRPRRFAS
jgi:hypothetical protein